jgi:signal transduction histidine kinase
VTGPAVTLPAGVQLTAYRVVQEALTNSLRHSGPGARAAVRLDCGPGRLELEVSDDGGAGPRAADGSGGSGLVGMRERVRAYGGDLSAGPAGGGWRVAARLRVDA